MAIFLNTASAKQLLATFRKQIDDGHVDTWSYDTQGFFTHTTPQWHRKAFLWPTVENSRLALGVYKPQGGSITLAIYGIYQGRFIESLITHCNALFDLAQATPRSDATYDNL